MKQPIRIAPGTRVRLDDFDPDDTSRCDDKDSADKLGDERRHKGKRHEEEGRER